MNDQLEQARLMRCRHDWPVYHLKHLARLTGGGTPAKENGAFWEGGDVPWISPKDMKRRVITSAEDYITEDAVDGSATSFVDAGSPLMVVRSGILRHTLPVAIAGRRLTLNQDMKAFNLSSRLNPMFFVYWVEGQSSDLLLEWRQFGATVESIDTGRLLNGRVALPDLATQKAIAYFLDRETARIDQLIEKKQRMVEVLGEMRKAQIARLVVGGLASSVELTSTTVEWMPEAPSHWRVRRIATLFRESKEMGEEGLPVLSVSINWGISDRELRDEDRHRIVNQIQDKTAYKRVRPGDLVYNMMRAWQGAFGVATIDGLVSPAYVVARPNQEIHSLYFEPLLRTSMCIEEFRRTSKGIADFRQRLYWEHFRQVRVVLPPLEEQRLIAQKVGKILKMIGEVVDPVEASIDRLREFRAALITAAVTGQIDVSTWGKQGTTARRLDEIEGATCA